MANKKTVFMSNCTAQFHATFSNDKLGGRKQRVMAVGYVSGRELLYLNDGTLVSDCIGTCGCVDCSGCGKRGICYAIDSFCQYDYVTINRVENTMQLRQDIDKHFDDLRQALIDNAIEVLRHTESGEIETYAQFEKVVETADLFPNVTVYMYTKNYAVLREFFSKRELPENMTVLVSIWGETGVAEYQEFKCHDGIKAFVVNNDTVKVQAMCPAYMEVVKHSKKRGDYVAVVRVTEKSLVKFKGLDSETAKKRAEAVKCGNCQLCTRNRNCKVIGCLEH